MIAADAIKSLEARALAIRNLKIALVLIVVGVACLGIAYCAGSSRGAAKQRTATVDSTRAVRIDTIRAVETRFVHDTVTVRETAAHADTAREQFEAVASQVEAAAGRSDSVASSLALPAIQQCRTTIAADTIAYHAVVAALGDMTIDRNAWQSRALLDEANQPHVPRFGFRSGAIAGVLAVLTVLHFVR